MSITDLKLKRALIGAPFPTSREMHERLDKTRALAVFASDPISSNAYATEAIMSVLIVLGSGALSMTMPIAIGRGRAGADGHFQLYPDHPALSGRRRRLHRGQRQPGQVSLTVRRGCAARRLCPDRVGVRLGGRARGDLGLPRSSALQRVHCPDAPWSSSPGSTCAACARAAPSSPCPPTPLWAACCW